jgi:hypothetical protein
MTIQEWIDAYGQAWEKRDADAAGDLFTEDAVYRDHPLEEPHNGREGVRTYWRDVTASQDEVRVRFGKAIVDADALRAAVEFWVTMLNGGAAVTLTGILFLRFDPNGLCQELREAWHFAEGRLDPPSGWGT